MKKQRSTDYPIGKGRPPLESRWKRGESGNPKGRPGRTESLEELLQKVLHRRKATVLKGGKAVKLSLSQALIDTYVDAALKGNWKIAEFLLKTYYENRTEISRRRSERMTPGQLQKAMEAYKDSLETRPPSMRKTMEHRVK